MAILEEIAANIPFFEKMSPMDKEKRKIAVEAHCKLHKSKGKSHTFNTYKMVGSIELQSEQLIARIHYVLSKHQNELQSSIVKMMEGLPQKLKKAQSEGLTTVL